MDKYDWFMICDYYDLISLQILQYIYIFNSWNVVFIRSLIISLTCVVTLLWGNWGPSKLRSKLHLFVCESGFGRKNALL